MVPLSLGLLGCADRDPTVDRREVPAPEPIVVASGQASWTAVFDDVARAAGAADCTYSRLYEAREDRSTPWLCPDCDVVLAATITMSEEDRACFRAVTGSAPSDVERLGWDGTRMMRAGTAFAPLSEVGLRTDQGAEDRRRFAGVSDPIPLAAGTVQLWIEGELTLEVEDQGDPWNGMSPPPSYRCGWPVLDPPAYDGPWRISLGEQAPDGWFRDACDEPVRLHDFAGTYVVIDVSAADCGPCQTMAAGERAFSAEIRALGLEVVDVTLLSPSLDDPLAPADAELIGEWTEAFDLGSVVLGDRGWGYTMSVSVWPESLSYPSWFVLSPAYEVLATGQGYSSWDEMRDVIVDHWRQ